MRTHLELCEALDVTPRIVQNWVNLGIIRHSPDAPKQGRGRARLFTREEWFWAFTTDWLAGRNYDLQSVKVVVDTMRSCFANSEHDYFKDALTDECAVIFTLSASEDGNGNASMMRMPTIFESADGFSTKNPEDLEDLFTTHEGRVAVSRVFAAVQRGDDLISLNSVIQRANEAYEKSNEMETS